MQVPILKGIFTDEASDYRSAYPRNLVPVPKKQGISLGYLRPSEGIIEYGVGTGVDRGGINWDGICYRVMGSRLVRVDIGGSVVTIGDVGDNGLQCSMDYSFDYLAIASNKKLFLYDGITLTEVTDPDLGVVLDVVWIDGYFMTTDGESLVVSELTDPFSINPLKYGSSEIDPDPVVALKELRNEIAAVNRYTIEFFDNVGGAANEFPFQRRDGAQLQRGAVGTKAVAVFDEAIGFVGSRLNEAIAVWEGRNGSTKKLSTREIDTILEGYTEEQLALVVVEARSLKEHEFLYIHLPDKTLVYDLSATRALGDNIWHTLDSGRTTPKRYRVFNFVRVYDKWLCGDPTSDKIGCMDDKLSSHYGEIIGWDMSTQILFNEGNGFIVHETKLIGLTGRAALGDDPRIWASYSSDGETWSIERAKKAGKQGERNKRLEWNRQGEALEMRIQRFRGTSEAHIGIARLEMRIEGTAF